MKDLIEVLKLDPRAATTAIVVFIFFIILLMIGHNSFTPILIEKYFGIENDISASIKDGFSKIESSISNKQSPVGYTRTFDFDERVTAAHSVPQALNFYAQPGQHVRLTINSSAYPIANDAERPTFQVMLDDSPLTLTHNIVGLPSSITTEITTLPRETTNSDRNIHLLRIQPAIKLRKTIERLNFDCIILVSNAAL